MVMYDLMYHIVSSFQEAHVNACYKHFYYFVREFSLVETKEFEPLVSVNLSIGNTVYRCK